MIRPKLLAGVALGGMAAALSLPAGAQSIKNPVVTAAVQVTSNPNPVRAHSSPQIAVNPKNGELVIVETNTFEDFRVKVHLSVDDGRSWFPGGDPMMKPFTWNSDYAINGPYFTTAFDSNGDLLVAFTATDPKYANVGRNDRPRNIFLARSGDGGRSFTTDFVYRAPENDKDKLVNRRPMLAIDPKAPKNLYVGWMQGTAGFVTASTDGGKTWGDPVKMGDDDRHYQPRLAVDGKGVVHAVFPSGEFVADNPPVRPVFYRQSTDNGKTWSPKKVIEPGSAGFFHNRKHLLAADPKNNNLYFVWYGNTKEKPTAEDDNEIFMRVSYDSGATWSDRITVNDDAQRTNTQHYDPGIAIAPNGRIDVAWYDFRNSPQPEVIPKNFGAPFNHGGFNDVYYSNSTDGGRTWRENLRVSDRLIDRRIGVWSNNVHSHYSVGIASTDKSVYLTWQDSRAGDQTTNAEDIYFASIKLDPDDIVVGSASSSTGVWPAAAAGLVLGMGVAMVLALALSRRSQTAERVGS